MSSAKPVGLGESKKSGSEINSTSRLEWFWRSTSNPPRGSAAAGGRCLLGAALVMALAWVLPPKPSGCSRTSPARMAANPRAGWSYRAAPCMGTTAYGGSSEQRRDSPRSDRRLGLPGAQELRSVPVGWQRSLGEHGAGGQNSLWDSRRRWHFGQRADLQDDTDGAGYQVFKTFSTNAHTRGATCSWLAARFTGRPSTAAGMARV